MIFAEAYVDESGTHDGSPMLTVAGYMFKREQARRFSRDWEKVLSKHGLPFAHQTDCATGNGHYKAMCKDERITVQSALIEHIKRRTIFGFGVSVDPRAYTEIVGIENNAPSAYTFALQGCFTIIRRWVERTNFAGYIAYVFEAGHASEAEAARYIRDALLKSDSAKQKHRYVSHNFIDKRFALPLQAADMLAWQYHHYLARRIEKGITNPRADFSALIRKKDVCIEHNNDSLVRFRKEVVDEGWLTGRY
ncbi:DUF3800 domain-containing protein [Novosphingobium sp. EMRT-2]|uniref:DUF3800 domain-containing protein n=1 Tax=Novosphingobium sp. EMRT-2 TaxID=2571749 RepID=UPI00143D7D99|nr:DUF3800 domain-containing protein [Novosphingobium sp. EMRT-2]